MTTRLFALALLGSSAFALPAAHAADIILPPVEYVEEVQPAYSGWYIRGDVGYVFENDTDGDYDFFNPDPLAFGVDNTEKYDKFTLRDGASFGGGVGYRFTDYFRMDATVDYFKTDFNGSSRCGYLVEIGYFLNPVENDCRYDDKSEATVWTTMANAYVDLGTYGRFTPYIGAGIGAAYVDYEDTDGLIACGGKPCFGQSDVFRASQKGEATWRFASSLMAGATVDITRNLALDAGYRYTRIEGGDAFGYDQFDSALGATGVQTRDNGFDIHAIRAGLRYSFF